MFRIVCRVLVGCYVQFGQGHVLRVRRENEQIRPV